MVISTIGALILGEHTEGLMVIFLYELGKILESLAVAKSRKSVSELMDIKENSANLKDGDIIKRVPTQSVKINDIIIIKDGERIPLDGIVVCGDAYLDSSALTGEASLIFAITVKLSVLILSLLGISTMWEAVFADVGVTVLCILNTLRLLNK